MTDERFEEFLTSALDELDDVPPTPREALWSRIEAERAAAARRDAERKHNGRIWLSWGVGIAAVLAIGVGLGRLSVRTQLDLPVGASVAANDVGAAAVNRTAYKLTVAQHMTNAEALLTTFRAQPKGMVDPEMAEWARDLLTNTRLLLDSPASDDPKVAALLEDLELITAQIARLSGPSSEEREIIREGIQQTEVLPRLRATMPAGPAAAGT